MQAVQEVAPVAVPTVNEARESFKRALVELIREEPDFVREILRDIVDDIVDAQKRDDEALVKAIEEGHTSEYVSEEEIRRILRGEEDGDGEPLNGLLDAPGTSNSQA